MLFGFSILLIWESGSLEILRIFFTKWNNVFIGSGYIAITIGLIATALSILQAKKQNQANLTYQIQKDSIELEKSIQDEIIYNYILSKKPIKIEDKKRKLAERKIREILQFYANLHSQFEFGNFTKKEWNSIYTNFSNVLSYYNVEKYWNDKKISEDLAWPKNFREMGNNIIQKKENEKP